MLGQLRFAPRNAKLPDIASDQAIGRACGPAGAPGAVYRLRSGDDLQIAAGLLRLGGIPGYRLARKPPASTACSVAPSLRLNSSAANLAFTASVLSSRGIGH
jgi:hypothetical protein